MRRRLPPEERRHLILVAARTVFTRTGDLSATPVRAIAAHAGVSEAIIYHYFRSKEELFSEAVVEPLRESTTRMSETALTVDDGERAEEKVLAFWRDLIGSLAEMLPLLGFVLFGNPSEAGEFHRSTLTPAITEMASPWQDDCDQRGIDHPNDLVAWSCVGIALVFALDARYHRDGDPDGDLRALTRLTTPGFWPAL